MHILKHFFVSTVVAFIAIPVGFFGTLIYDKKQSDKLYNQNSNINTQTISKNFNTDYLNYSDYSEGSWGYRAQILPLDPSKFHLFALKKSSISKKDNSTFEFSPVLFFAINDIPNQPTQIQKLRKIRSNESINICSGKNTCQMKVKVNNNLVKEIAVSVISPNLFSFSFIDEHFDIHMPIDTILFYLPNGKVITTDWSGIKEAEFFNAWNALNKANNN